MGARPIVIGSISGKNIPQVRPAKDDDLIEAFAPKCTDESFGNSVLPWQSGADWPVTDAHSLEPAGEYLAVSAVIVPDHTSVPSPGETLR